MKKIIIVLSIVCFGNSVVNAQRSFTSLQYSIGFGAGDLKNFISKTSFRGITFDWRKNVNPNVGVGLELGWNVFYEAKS